MEALTDKAAYDLQDELGSLAYRNPEGGAWETAERKKLRKEAEAANDAIELKPCQPITRYALRFRK